AHAVVLRVSGTATGPPRPPPPVPCTTLFRSPCRRRLADRRYSLEGHRVTAVRCSSAHVLVPGCPPVAAPPVGVRQWVATIPGGRKLHITYVIALPCVDVKDRSCVDECPVDCIYEGNWMLYIQPDECVDCGACEPVCPVEAIYYEVDTPDQWAEYYQAN